MKSVHSKFLSLWKGLPTTVFEKLWHNGTGYMNGAVRAKLDTPHAFQAPEPDSRKGIIIPTKVGNLVVFERYSPGNSDVLVCNGLRGCLFGSALSAEAIELCEQLIKHGKIQNIAGLDKFLAREYKDSPLLEQYRTEMVEELTEAGLL